MCYRIEKRFSKYDFRLRPEVQIYTSKSVSCQDLLNQNTANRVELWLTHSALEWKMQKKKRNLQKKKEGTVGHQSLAFPQGFFACPDFIDTIISFCILKAQLCCEAGSAAMPIQWTKLSTSCRIGLGPLISMGAAGCPAWLTVRLCVDQKSE